MEKDNKELSTMSVKKFVAAAILVTASTATQANSVYLDPASQNVALGDGTASLDLWMDFTTGTIGGGVNLILDGPISLSSFTPSPWFTTEPDASFSGHGTDKADAGTNFGIYIGDFSPLSGTNLLGTVTVGLDGPGTGTIGMSLNNTWGGGAFFTASADTIPVTLSGASLEIAAVPIPAAIWLLGTGLVAFGFTYQRKKA